MPDKQRVLVVGGTGFLGYHAILEFLHRGWQITSLGLPPAPPSDLFPKPVRTVLCDVERTSDDELIAILRGHPALVFAAGLDDRHAPRRPAYPKFQHANVEMPRRLLGLAKQAGVRRAVVLGSYFAHFARIWPEMNLEKHHPYIRSRIEQEAALTSINELDVCVLELPYIFGALPIPGWKPLWYPLVRYVHSSPLVFYMRGGSACISAQTVGRAIVAAVERGAGGKCYPLGQENLSWQDLLVRLSAPGRRIRVVTLPDWIIRMGLWGLWLVHLIQGKESGLDARFFTPLQTAETYIDPQPSLSALGYEPGDLEEALQATVEICR